jgi:arsenate reductase
MAQPYGPAIAPISWQAECMEIWINPACSKCRTALSILDEAGATYTTRRYLDDPPTAVELGSLLARLGLEPWDITRMGEAEAKELKLASWPKEPAARTRWIETLAAHPILIQRPIITADSGAAAVARSDTTVRAMIAEV